MGVRAGQKHATSTDPEAVGPNDARVSRTRPRSGSLPPPSTRIPGARRRGAARARAAELPALFPQAVAETRDASHPQHSHAADLYGSCASPPPRNQYSSRPRNVWRRGRSKRLLTYETKKKRTQNNVHVEATWLWTPRLKQLPRPARRPAVTVRVPAVTGGIFFLCVSRRSKRHHIERVARRDGTVIYRTVLILI